MKKANADGAHLDLPVHQVHLAPADQLASKDTLALPANLARTVPKDHQAHLVQPAKKEKMARTAKRENLAKTPKKETKDHQAHQAKLANQVQLVRPATKARPANQETKPTTDHPDHLVKEANPETKDPLDHPVRKAPQVQMPTIVLARVVPPPRLPPPRPPKSKKPHDPRSIYRPTHLGLDSAFNFDGDHGKFVNPVLRFFETTTSFHVINFLITSVLVSM